MKLEWDARKAAFNLRKHGVSFEEAGTVFGDPMALTFDDPDHSIGEMRFLTFGLTRTDKLLIVSHTERHGVTRIISARKMSPQERVIYENG
ncbi:MAG: BrnT family toxin [Chromatiaceae bacterium]|nr:BrnT family toxin [Chromatiaceae bacterium]MCF8004514.1 BrnT family toxin [Chromatiaceae bacterium]